MRRPDPEEQGAEQQLTFAAREREREREARQEILFLHKKWRGMQPLMLRPEHPICEMEASLDDERMKRERDIGMIAYAYLHGFFVVGRRYGRLGQKLRSILDLDTVQRGILGEREKNREQESEKSQ